ncbi:MAG: DNA-binding protein [Shinella sp.]|jgi:hypothetical protein|nr:DNA-binding protein [Shinella sp.]
MNEISVSTPDSAAGKVSAKLQELRRIAGYSIEEASIATGLTVREIDEAEKGIALPEQVVSRLRERLGRMA